MARSSMVAVAFALFFTLLPLAGPAQAGSDCEFTISGKTMAVVSDCVTDETIVVPNGYTLAGRGRMITAVDPPGGHFIGPVVRNEGDRARVLDLVIETSALVNACEADDERLAGILFEEASGEIRGNTILRIRRPDNGCQEGNGIVVRNPPFDGSRHGTEEVEIINNRIFDYQKTGINVNGDVDAIIRGNVLGASANQEFLAANGIQVGFGARATVRDNLVEGNTYLGFDPIDSPFLGTAILLFGAAAETTVVTNEINLIAGDGDIGIVVQADGVAVKHNRVLDTSDDAIPDIGEIGIANFGFDEDGSNNVVRFNTVRCFASPLDNVSSSPNFVLPCKAPAVAAATADLAPAPAARPAREVSPSAP